MVKFHFLITCLAAVAIATPTEAQQRVPVRTTTNFVQFPAELCRGYTASDRIATLSSDGFFCDIQYLNRSEGEAGGLYTLGTTSDGYRISVSSSEFCGLGSCYDRYYVSAHANGVKVLEAWYGQLGLERISVGSSALLAEFAPEINALRERIDNIQ